jgi:hypothetical protein
MLQAKFKSKKNTPRESLRLLSSGQSVSNPIAIVTISSLILNALSFPLLIVNYGATSSLARKEPPSLVQLADGNTVNVKGVDSKERTSEVIKTFVSNTLVKMFNWNGLLESVDETGVITKKPDPGVQIKLKKGVGKIPTRAWQAAFALSEKEDFRAKFIQKLAEITPSNSLSGRMQISLLPTHISEPVKIGEGRWKVNVIATLLTFDTKESNQGSGIAFNKTIIVQAVTPLKVPVDSTEINNAIYLARSSGLEITEITDLDLGNK